MILDKSWDKSNHFRLLVLVILTITYLPVSSQNFQKIENKATRNYDEGNFVEARDQFSVLFDAEWNKNVSASYLASCYLELDMPLKSYEVLSQITEPDPVNSYLMILTNYYLENFEEADRLLKDFKDTAGFDIQSLSGKITMAERNYASNTGILLQNFGSEVNSEHLEYSAVMYNGYNQLLFTSRKEENGSITDVDGLAFENIYFTELDLTDNWKKPIPFNVEIKEKRSHDATVQFFHSKNEMILYHDGQLYSATLKDGVWSKDHNLDLHSEKGSDTHCFITSDEKTIFFASDYLSDGEHLDLFVSHKEEDSEWSEPHPLNIFNTDLDEDSPFLANDSTFYFSSNGHNSMGGYDVFKSTYDRVKEEWGAPENMGYPVNTVAEDIYYTTDGKLAYLSSNRLGGYGSLDLYRVFLFNRVKVQGKLLDDNHEPIVDAEIDIKYDTTTIKSYTDSNGDYELFIPINTKLHITFIKDSLNLVEGDYIANVFFKDQNNNEFNFLIDYADTNPETINGNKDDQVVRHINIDVKNDYEDNPIIASVSDEKEKEWTDSLNRVAIEKQKVKREISTASKKTGENFDISSSHLKIRDAQISANKKINQVENETNRIVRIDGQQTERIENVEKWTDDKELYTVQILAMSRLKPDDAFFHQLDTAVINNIDGKDGLKRYFTGKYESKEEAIKAMRTLRSMGYYDAFIRRIKKYEEL